MFADVSKLNIAVWRGYRVTFFLILWSFSMSLTVTLKFSISQMSHTGWRWYKSNCLTKLCEKQEAFLQCFCVGALNLVDMVATFTLARFTFFYLFTTLEQTINFLPNKNEHHVVLCQSVWSCEALWRYWSARGTTTVAAEPCGQSLL